MEDQAFVEEFISNLRVPMTYIENQPSIVNTLKFAASFCMYRQVQIEADQKGTEANEMEMCPFLQQIFNFLLAHHEVDYVAVIYDDYEKF